NARSEREEQGNDDRTHGGLLSSVAGATGCRFIRTAFKRHRTLFIAPCRVRSGDRRSEDDRRDGRRRGGRHWGGPRRRRVGGYRSGMTTKRAAVPGVPGRSSRTRRTG